MRKSSLQKIDPSFQDFMADVQDVVLAIENGRKVNRQYLSKLLIEAVTRAENMQTSTVDQLTDRIANANGLSPDDTTAIIEALAGINDPMRRTKALRFLAEVLPDIITDTTFEIPYADETEYEEQSE